MCSSCWLRIGYGFVEALNSHCVDVNGICIIKQEIHCLKHSEIDKLTQNSGQTRIAVHGTERLIFEGLFSSCSCSVTSTEGRNDLVES